MRAKKWTLSRIFMILAGMVLAIGINSCSTVADEPASTPENPEMPGEPDGQPDPDPGLESSPLVGQWRLHIGVQVPYDSDSSGHYIWVDWVDLNFREDGSLTYSYEPHKLDNGNIVDQEMVESGRHSYTKTDDRIVVYDQLSRQVAEFKYVITDDRLTLTLISGKSFPAFIVKGKAHRNSADCDFEAGVEETYLRMPIQMKESWNPDIIGKWKAPVRRVVNTGTSTITAIEDMYLEFKDGVSMTFSYVTSYARKSWNWDETVDHIDTSYSEAYGDEYTYKMSDDIIFIYRPGEDIPVTMLGYTMIDDEMEVTVLEGLPIPYVLYDWYQYYPSGSKKYTKILE